MGSIAMSKLHVNHAGKAGRLQAGFALGEMLLAVAVVAVLVGIGAVVYGNIRGGIAADDQAGSTIELVSEIQKNWRNAGTFATV